MRYCTRCGRRLTKTEKLKMCNRCRKETVRQFLTQTLDDIEEIRQKKVIPSISVRTRISTK